jgi:cell cycle checkpoint protein
MWFVQIRSAVHIYLFVRAEDASGPTTTCEIQTSNNDSSIELPFDNSQTYVRTGIYGD